MLDMGFKEFFIESLKDVVDSLIIVFTNRTFIISYLAIFLFFAVYFYIK